MKPGKKTTSLGSYRNLLGYKYMSNCRKKCQGGGVALYIKKVLNYNKRLDLIIMKEAIF